ncbi:MAG TPA: hypothetical protein VGI93_09290 [Steroidobacteraceae bacterium]
MHHRVTPSLSCALTLVAFLTLGPVSLAAVNDELEPETPAAFLPGGMLGVQIGASWEESKKNKSFENLNCQVVEPKADDADEVCFFKTAAASRVGGAAIHDGFMVRKGDQLVLIGTGIAIKDADDPLADSVVKSFQSQIHSRFQQLEDQVLFVKMPARRMNAQELAGFSEHAPVLLVQLEHKSHELAVLYGYLAPVNLFGSLSAE